MLAGRVETERQKPLDVIIEEARLAALNSYRLLGSGAVDGLSRLSQEAAGSLAATHAAVSFVDETRVWFGGTFALGRSDVARENSFCDAVVRSASPLLVPDGRSDPRFWQHELVRGEPGLRCYAGVPLIDHGGYALGAVAVFSITPAAFASSILQDLAALAVLVRDFLEETRGRVLPAVTPVQGWLGVRTLKPEEGRAGSCAGLVVLRVATASPAQRAGLRPTDILHSIGGQELSGSADVVRAMAGRAAGSTVSVTFRRSGEWHQGTIEIEPKRRRLR